MTDLSLIPTDDLLEAVAQRFDGHVFAGWRCTGTDRDDTEVRFEGSPLVCQGLCMDMVREIQRAQDEHEEREDLP